VTRPPAAVTAIALLMLGACIGRSGDDRAEVIGAGTPAPASVVEAVEVAATPCSTPNRRIGAGVLVDEGLVLTAAHVVDGNVRAVTVDAAPARVLAVAPRLDAALVATDAQLDARIVELAVAPDTAAAVQIVTPDHVTPVTMVRRTDLVVHDTTARREHRRRALVLDLSVAGGTSGAAVVDERGHVVAIVTMTDRARAVTYATDASELTAFLLAHDGGWTDSDVGRLDRHAACS
jgi:S1-C subfamily serine protease